MRVTKQDRARAKKQLMAIAAISKSASKFAKRGLSTYDGIGGIIMLQPVLRDCGVAAHLTGVDAVLGQLPLKAHQESPFDETIKKLHSRRKVDLDKLRDAYGDKARDALSELKRSVEQKLAEEVEEEGSAGLHVKAGTASLAKAFDAAGISPTNSFQLENLFRTQMMLGYGGGRWQAAQDPAIKEVLKAYRYVTVGDDRVSEGCQSLEGMIAGTEHRVWHTCWPPNHYSCRCQPLMVFDWDGEEDVPDEEVLQEAVAPGFGYNPGELF